MSKRVFPSGSVRDNLGDKPRLELIPYDLFLKRVGKLYTTGAEQYGDNNWRKGQPISSTIGSLQRHLAKYIMGETDEDHLSAVVWNALSLLNTDEYFKDDPLLNDIKDWYKGGIPTGKGNWEEKQMNENEYDRDKIQDGVYGNKHIWEELNRIVNGECNK